VLLCQYVSFCVVQVQGGVKTKSEHLAPLVQVAQEVKEQLTSYDIQHTTRYCGDMGLLRDLRI
jgi:hypothetical protein